LGLAADADGFTVYASTYDRGVATWTSSHRPVLIAPLRLAGKASQGHDLRVTALVDAAPAATLAYAWLRCNAKGTQCAQVGKAHGVTYRLGASDVGHRMRAQVTAKNRRGHLVARSSASGLVQ
jgi:hypothetical protein